VPGPPIQKGKSPQGPPGCNLFIFHVGDSIHLRSRLTCTSRLQVPNDMTNRDVYSMFAPFGNVLSARIMVERDTGRSRGFGCVT
jgi:CUG-BP- and ETR3-like factor